MTEQQNIPKHWEIKKLGEVCDELFAGGDVPKGNYSLNYCEEYKIPIFANGEKNKGLYGYTNIPRVNYPAVTISARGTIGLAEFRKVPFFPVVRLIVLKPNKLLSPHFLKYAVDNINIKYTGSSIPQLTVPTVKNLSIPLPPLQEQQAIVAKIEELLSDLENGKQQLLKAQQQLKVYRQSLLKWAFEGKLTNINVKEGELPEGWKWVKITDIGKVKGGKRLPSKHQYSENETDFQYIMAGNLKNGTVTNKRTYIDEKTFLVLNNYRVQGGEVYITIVGACIGDAGIIPQNIGKAILTENAAKIIDLKEVSNLFLAKWINSFNCQLQIKSKILSATLGKLALNRIGTIELPLPPLSEQQQIVEILESKLTVCDKLEETISQSLTQSETLRQSILKRAFEGRLV